MSDDITSVNISKKHDRILEKIIEKTRRSKKAEVELMIEKEATTIIA